jgi:hypothetical protein
MFSAKLFRLKSLHAMLAERVGFEPTVDLRLRQFSRLVP